MNDRIDQNSISQNMLQTQCAPVKIFHHYVKFNITFK